MGVGKDFGVIDYDAVSIGKLLLVFRKRLVLLFWVTKQTKNSVDQSFPKCAVQIPWDPSPFPRGSVVKFL